MINTRKIGGVLHLQCSTTENMGRRQDALILFPLRLPKGGQRWDNTSEIGGVING